LGKPSNEQISAQELKSASFSSQQFGCNPSQNGTFFVGFCKAYMFNEEHCAIEAARFSVFFFSFLCHQSAKYCHQNTNNNKWCVTLLALPFTSKKYLKTKRRIMETQIYGHAKI
jgi:hypothetical protein